MFYFCLADTPGTLDSEGRDFKHAISLVDAMRDRVKSVDLILLLFNGKKTRFQQATIESLQLLEGIFSPSFWENTARFVLNIQSFTFSFLTFFYPVPSHSGHMISGPFVNERRIETSQKRDSTVHGTNNTETTSKFQSRFRLCLSTPFFQSLTMRLQKISRRASGKLLRGRPTSCGLLPRRERRNRLSAAAQSATHLPITLMGSQSFREGRQASTLTFYSFDALHFLQRDGHLLVKRLNLLVKRGLVGPVMPTPISAGLTEMEPNTSSTPLTVGLQSSKPCPSRGCQSPPTLGSLN